MWGKFDAELREYIIAQAEKVEEVVDNDWVKINYWCPVYYKDWEMVFNWCPGITIGDVHASKLSDERKEVVEVGLQHLIRESWQVKYKLSNPTNPQWRPRK